MRSKRTVLQLAVFLFVTQANAERVLVIGDSLTCGPFGNHLFKILDEKHDVTLYCAVSSAASHWASGTNPKRGNGKFWPCHVMTSKSKKLELCNGSGKLTKLADAIVAHSPSRVIIALGTNSMYTPTPDLSYKAIATLAAADSRKCQWIGPPHFDSSKNPDLAIFEKNLNPFYTKLNQLLNNSCQMIDSRAATAKGTAGFVTTDGIHRNEAGGRFWAHQIKNDLD